jgi:hypothetical protein
MTSPKKLKSLSDVLIYYNILYAKEEFVIIKSSDMNQAVKDDIAFTLERVPYKASEAAICENLIYPLIKDAWKHYVDIFSLWSHKSLVNETGFLTIPDYLISKQSNLGEIIFDFPVLAVIEAKKDNFTSGWTQCTLDMIKIREMNQNETMTVYGIVTNGEDWEIGKLEQNRFVLYKERFFIEQLEILFNALISVLELCKLQLIELNLVK